MSISPRRSSHSPHSPPRPLARRSRAAPAGADDVARLSLAEVRDRLARNERVLASGLFASPSPSASPSAGPSSAASASASASALGSSLGASPGSAYLFGGRAPPGGTPASPTDPVREKLLAVRQQLRAREEEIMLEQATAGVGHMGVGAGAPPARDGRRASATRSGKQRALESIRAGEEHRPANGIILPMSQTLELGERDFDNQTAAALDALSLRAQPAHALPPRPSDRLTHADELERAAQSARYAAGLDTRAPRLRNGAYAYAADADGAGDGEARRGYAEGGDGDGDGDMFDDDDVYDGAEEREYDGSGMPLDAARDDEPATGEMEEDEMDGEDNERFEEGNDEYELAGADSRQAGPDA